MSGRAAIRRAASSGWERLARTEAPELPFESLPSDGIALAPLPGTRALEDDGFPFEALSDVAETESWRKEINRPTTHIHKWWAQRLGTVFRAMTIGAFAPSGTDIFDLFYKPVRIPGGTVFDPFMGSGTTLAETVKLGAKAVGRDINPVAHFLVKCALSVHDRAAILDTFHAIERDVAGKLRSFYRATLPDGTQAEVLYYFWVKTADCPSCASPVDLFSSQIFARHAYPKKFPQSQAVCLHCGGINEVHVEARDTKCGLQEDVRSGTQVPPKGRARPARAANTRFRLPRPSARLANRPRTGCMRSWFSCRMGRRHTTRLPTRTARCMLRPNAHWPSAKMRIRLWPSNPATTPIRRWATITEAGTTCSTRASFSAFPCLPTAFARFPIPSCVNCSPACSPARLSSTTCSPLTRARGRARCATCSRTTS